MRTHLHLELQLLESLLELGVVAVVVLQHAEEDLLVGLALVAHPFQQKIVFTNCLATWLHLRLEAEALLIAQGFVEPLVNHLHPALVMRRVRLMICSCIFSTFSGASLGSGPL